MGSDIGAVASALDISPGDLVSHATGSFFGGGIFMIVGIILFGIVARPLFIVIMTNARFSNPLADSSGPVWILTAVSVIVLGMAFAGRGGRAIQMAETNIVNPVRISLLHRDVCEPSHEPICMLVRVGGQDLWVHGHDRRVFWAEPFAMNFGWRHLYRPPARPASLEIPDWYGLDPASICPECPSESSEKPEMFMAGKILKAN